MWKPAGGPCKAIYRAYESYIGPRTIFSPNGIPYINQVGSGAGVASFGLCILGGGYAHLTFILVFRLESRSPE